MLSLSSPLSAYLELTSVCSNHCPGCGNVFADDRRSQPLSSVQWRNILVKLKPCVQQIKLTGGEPTLHPEFGDIIAAIRELDIPFVLFTNARWLDSSSLIRLLRTTPQCGGLLVSLHGSTAASHDAFTNVADSFATTIANVQRAVEAGLSTTTSTVITRYNYAEIGDIVRLSRELGAHHAVFNRYLGLPLPNIEPTEEQLQLAIQTIDAERQAALRGRQPAVKFGNCIPQCFFPSPSTGCLAGATYCTVDPWGNVRPCNHAPLLCGNLLEQSIEDIWHGSALQQWRSLIPHMCRSCSAISQCRGGCRAVALIQGLDVDPLTRGPLPVQERPLQELVLHENARPLRHFRQRAEPFGYALIDKTRILPVTSQAEPVLNALDGVLTLREIQELFGSEALDFVGSLHQMGLVVRQS